MLSWCTAKLAKLAWNENVLLSVRVIQGVFRLDWKCLYTFLMLLLAEHPCLLLNCNRPVSHIQVYKLQGGTFVAQNVNLDNTRSASGLAVFENAGTLKLAIAFFNDSASSQSFQTKSPIYEWRTNSNSFVLLQEVDTNGPVGVEYFEHKGGQYLVFANSKSSVEIYRWNGNRFNSVQVLPTSYVQSAKPYVAQGNGKSPVWPHN